MNIRSIISTFLTMLMATISLAEDIPSIKETSWTGHNFRAQMGATFDFELPLNKGSGYPVQAALKYGYEYGYHFTKVGIYIGGGLDWSIIYPRNFEFKNKSTNWLEPPIALWWAPMTDIKIGWAPNNNWLATVGIVYLWGLSNSVRYRYLEHAFIELSSIVWIDRLLDTSGAFGEGFDNLMLTLGLGSKL